MLIAAGTAILTHAGKETIKIKLTRKGELVLRYIKYVNLTAKANFAPIGGSGVIALKPFTLKR